MLLPGRLRRSFARQRAERRLEREFAALMDTASGAYPARTASASGPRIAIASFGSGNWHLVLEILLAHALALRGASPELLMCDLPVLPACDERTSLLRRPNECPGCLPAKRTLLHASRIPWRGISAFMADNALNEARTVVDGLRDEDLADYVRGPWPLGRWIYVSTCHFLLGDARGNEPDTIAARRWHLTAAIVVVEAVQRWLDEVRPDVVIAESGAHFMWRIAFELARARGIRVVCREIGKGGWDSHIYSLNAECMFPNLTDIWEESRHVPLSPQQLQDVNAFMRSLPAKTYASAETAPPAEDQGLVSPKLGLRRDRRVVVLFTGVTWDLATAGRDVGFDGMFDWIVETLRLAASLPDVQFVIRAHPAENTLSTRERALDRIKERWPDLPPNVITVGPETAMSVRGLCQIADLVLAYCSTTGIEAAIYEKPVMVCGAPHYRGKGFTIDIASRLEYVDIFQRWARGELDHCPREASETARRYFHLFFLRYHIGMGWTTSPLEPPYELKVTELSELLPGRNGSVDVVCAGILDGREILLPI